MNNIILLKKDYNLTMYKLYYKLLIDDGKYYIMSFKYDKFDGIFINNYVTLYL